MVDAGGVKVVAEETREIQELNTKLPGDFKIAIVPVDQLEFLEKNARYMKNEQFQNLVQNIKDDGGLSQLPFCWKKPNGKFLILSGNHRCSAAIQAGMTEIPIMFTDKDLKKDERLAIQLSHNSISGQDDPLILSELYNEIEDLNAKYYSGLDDKVLEQLENVQLEGFSEAQLDFLTLSFLFLPAERDDLFKAFDKAKEQISNETALARYEDFDRLLEAEKKVQASYNVHNSATAVMLILDIFNRHQEDLKDGWLDDNGEPLHKEWVPVSSIFGTDCIPAESAAVINRAVDKALTEGTVSKKNKWELIEYLSAEYLAGD